MPANFGKLPSSQVITVANVTQVLPKLNQHVNDILEVLEEEGETGWKRLEEEQGNLSSPINIYDTKSRKNHEYPAESLLLEAARRGLPTAMDVLIQAGTSIFGGLVLCRYSLIGHTCLWDLQFQMYFLNYKYWKKFQLSDPNKNPKNTNINRTIKANTGLNRESD